MPILLDGYQFASDGFFTPFYSTGTNSMALGPSPVLGVSRSDTLPFPDTESTQKEVYQFIFIIGYTGSPTSYPDLYGSVHVRISDGATTIIEWDANVTNPARTLTTGYRGEDNLSPYTSVLTPPQTPIADVRVANRFTSLQFGSSLFASEQSLPAMKKLTTARIVSGSFENHYFSVYSEPFVLDIPNTSQVEAQMIKSFDNTNTAQYYALALYNSLGTVMNLIRVGGTRTTPIVRGVIPANVTSGPNPPATKSTVAAGFYWQSANGTWNRVGDFTTTAGAINDRSIPFDSNGDHDVYGFDLNSNGIAIFRKLVVTTSGLMSPFFVHPNGYCYAAVGVGTDTQIVTYSETLNDKETICTLANVRPISFERSENDGTIYLGGVESGGSYAYASNDDGYSFTKMAQAFDNTYETYFMDFLFGGLAGCVATKSNSIKFKISYNSGISWEPEVTVGAQPSGMKGLFIRQHSPNGSDRLTITDSATCRFDSIDGGMTWSAIT